MRRLLTARLLPGYRLNQLNALDGRCVEHPVCIAQLADLQHKYVPPQVVLSVLWCGYVSLYPLLSVYDFINSFRNMIASCANYKTKIIIKIHISTHLSTNYLPVGLTGGKHIDGQAV